MSDLAKLRTEFEKAEQKAQKLQADKDQALEKVRDRFNDRLAAAVDDAAAKQKALNDAEAADALLDRPDGETLARTLGLTLPT